MALDPIARGAAAATAARTSISGNAALLPYRALGAKMTVPADMRSLRCDGYAAAGDGGRAFYRRVTAQPSHPASLRTADCYLPDGTTDAANGGWWELDEPVVDIRMFGASTALADNTAAINAAAAYVSAKGGGTVLIPAGVWRIKTDATHFLTLLPNVRFRGAAFSPGQAADVSSILVQTTDSTGFIFRSGPVQPDYCGVTGLLLQGPHTNIVPNDTSGSGGIDLRRYPGNGAIWLPVVQGCQFRFFAEEALIEDSKNGRFLANLAIGCLYRRTGRTGFAGVFTMMGVDGIMEDNEIGCSAQNDMSIANPAPYNATPLLAALYITAGNLRMQNNRMEISEIGVVNEGGQTRSYADHMEFNAAWGWLERGAGPTNIVAPYFCNNSGIRTGSNGTYSHFRKESANQSCRVVTPTVTTATANIWNVAIQALFDFEDAVGGGLLDFIPGGSVPYRVGTANPALTGVARFPAPANLLSKGENGLPNAMATGAATGSIGSGGALPVGWSITTANDAGMTFAVDSVGDDNGLGYIVLSITGTSTATATGTLRLDFAAPNNRPAALAGEAWTFSLATNTPSYTGLNYVQTVVEEASATGGAIGSTPAATGLFQDKAPRAAKAIPMDACRTAVTRTFSNAGTRRANGYMFVAWSAGATVAAKIRIALPQLERGLTMSAPTPTRNMPSISRGLPGYVVATTGGTTAMGVRQEVLALDPAATLAAYTVTLPAAPQGGDRATITTSQTITALTVGGGAYPVVGAPATLAAGGAASFAFDPTGGKWFRT